MTLIRSRYIRLPTLFSPCWEHAQSASPTAPMSYPHESLLNSGKVRNWTKNCFNRPPSARKAATETPFFIFFRGPFSATFCGQTFQGVRFFDNKISGTNNEMWRFYLKDFYFHNLITLDTMSHILIWQITTFKLVWYAGYLFWK